ncbi:MAG: glycosyl transferase family 2, partial [Desulfovibrionaceae bacterium]|nr:glycosyl transferase family 2 [Desulfovibrionaceae bacterium]
RVSQATLVDQVLVAIPDTELDKVLAEHLKRLKVSYFQGSENDVLDRYVKAGQAAKAELIVRVCADNPLITGEVLDRLILFYLNHTCDYAYNHIPKNNLWPDGLGAEIVSFDLLQSLSLKAKQISEREHCLNYIWNHTCDFKILTFDPQESWLCRPEIKLDIDSQQDFQKLSLLPLNLESNLEEIITTYDQYVLNSK